jgi:flagellar secretion chaperone FliS
MTTGANQYKRTSVTTASPPQVLLMLYEAAIRHIKRAIECIEKKDLAGKGAAIGKTHDIINELSTSLNFEVGGAIAKDLERLYVFMTEELVRANIENDPKRLETILKLVTTLYDGWKVAVEQFNKEQGTKK